MKEKGFTFIPLIIAVTTVVVLSTAAYLLSADKLQVPGAIKALFSPLIKETGKLGEKEGLQIKQATGTEFNEEIGEPTPGILEKGIFELLKEMFSPGYFKKMDTPGQGEGDYPETKEEAIFPRQIQVQEMCSWEISREDLEKLGLHCSQIIGYYYGPSIIGTPSEEYGCNPVPGCQYDPEIVPFRTKEECQAVCGGL
jgi:hypothetical protein